jgi:hypothetical protein
VASTVTVKTHHQASNANVLLDALEIQMSVVLVRVNNLLVPMYNAELTLIVKSIDMSNHCASVRQRSPMETLMLNASHYTMVIAEPQVVLLENVFVMVLNLFANKKFYVRHTMIVHHKRLVSIINAWIHV